MRHSVLSANDDLTMRPIYETPENCM